MEYLPYIFGGARLLIGLVTLVKALGLFGSKSNPESFYARHQNWSIAIGGFLVLSGLYTIFFSTPDSYKI